MFPELRKIVTYDEVIHRDGDRAAVPPLRLFAAAAVLHNPWAGRGFVADLSPEITRIAPILGQALSDTLLAMAGGGDAIAAYGKAALCGTGCEMEHGPALIHTLRFGNIYRAAVGARTYLGFTNVRGPANSQIQVPLMDKHDAGRRSHYLTVQFSIADAPGPDELVVVLGASNGGRPHHRIGDRYQDIKAMGGTVDNPAGV